MLNGCDYAIQECNQIVSYIGSVTVTAPVSEETIRLYGEYKVVNIYPRNDNVYGVMFEIELPHLTIDN